MIENDKNELYDIVYQLKLENVFVFFILYLLRSDVILLV